MICFWRWMIWSQRFWCCRNFKITISLRLIWNSLNRQADWVSVFSISSSCTLHSRLRISRWSSVLILLGIVCNKQCFYGHSLLARSNTIIFFCFTRLIFCKIAIKLLSTIKTLSPSSVIMKTLYLKTTSKLLWIIRIPGASIFLDFMNYHYPKTYILKEIMKHSFNSYILWVHQWNFVPRNLWKIKNKNWPKQNSNFQQ